VTNLGQMQWNRVQFLPKAMLVLQYNRLKQHSEGFSVNTTIDPSIKTVVV